MSTDPTKPEAPLGVADREPLAVRAAVTAAVAGIVHVAVITGLIPIDESAEKSIAGAVDAIGLVVLLLWSRPRLVPAAKVIARVTSRGRVVAGEAAEQPTETVVTLSPTEEFDPAGAPDVTVRPELLADPHAHPEGPGV